MELKPGYKQTEVGVVPQDWEVAKMSEVCAMKSGMGITSANINQFSHYPCYGGNGLRGFTSRFTHDGRFALIGRQGALCGNVLAVEGQFFASEHAVVVTASAGTDVRWLTFILGEMRLNRYSESSAQPGLSVSKLLSLKLAIPPTKAEQEAIAEALSDADALIESLEQLIAKKRDLKQAAMQQLLTGQTRLPGFSEEWETVTAGEIGRFRGGNGFPLRCQGATTGAYPFFKVSDMNNEGNDTFMFTPNNWVSEAVRKTIGATLFPADSIVFAKVGAAIFLERKKILARPSCIDNNVSAFVLDAARADCRYIHYLMLRTKLGALVATTALPSLSGRQLSGISFRLPPLPEQIAIAAVLSEMDAEIAALEQRREKSRALKQGMMQELLTGRTRLV
jgi:type I restriction enzyme S subunit